MQGHAYPLVFIQPSVPFPPPAYDPGVCPPPLPTAWANAGTPYATALPTIPQDKITYQTGHDGVCYATNMGPLMLENFAEQPSNSERQEVSVIRFSNLPNKVYINFLCLVVRGFFFRRHLSVPRKKRTLNAFLAFAMRWDNNDATKWRFPLQARARREERVLGWWSCWYLPRPH